MCYASKLVGFLTAKQNTLCVCASVFECLCTSLMHACRGQGLMTYVCRGHFPLFYFSLHLFTLYMCF